jgi:two-component system KDP operon response regulator KdpE
MQRRDLQSRVNDTGLVEFGNVKIDLKSRLVTRANQAVHLTPIEYRLLITLVRNAERVVTSPQLLRAVWGPSHAESGHYLRIYMSHLRQKLEDDPTQPKYLQTETAVGYRLLLSLE